MEKWKSIAEIPKYQISNHGRVRKQIDGHPIKAYRRKGYPTVNLIHEGKIYMRGVHRLVAIAFVKGQDQNLHVAPIDGNKMNTKHSNLEWITPQETIARLVRRGAIRKLKKWVVAEDGSLKEIKRKEKK